MNWKNILEGFRNDLFPPAKLKEFLVELSESRLGFCKACPHNTTPGEVKRLVSRCDQCGCFLTAKSKALDESCPIGSWGPVASPEEDDEFKKAINEQGT